MGLRAGPGPPAGRGRRCIHCTERRISKDKGLDYLPSLQGPRVIILWCSWYKHNAEFLRPDQLGDSFPVDISRAQPCFCHGTLGLCVHRAICPGPTPSLPPAFLVTSAGTWVPSGLCLPSVLTSYQSLLPTQAPVEPLCWSRTASPVTHFPGLFPHQAILHTMAGETLFNPNTSQTPQPH